MIEGSDLRLWPERSLRADVQAERTGVVLMPVAGLDTVVVGGGTAGLAAGALLAKSGRDVVVVEAEDRAGGYAASIERDGYRFDRAVHLVGGGNPDGPYGPGLIYQVLDTLGVADRCEFIPVDPFFTLRLPGLTIQIPGERAAYVNAHAALFPWEEEDITGLVDLCSGLYQEMLDWPIQPRLIDWPTAPFRFPRLVRYLLPTSRRVTHRYLHDERLRTIYNALCPSYVDLPPSRASFLMWATMMATYLDEGVQYSRGGYQHLADTLAEGLTIHGGKLVLGHRVDRILLDDGRVAGVRLDDGETIIAGRVVSAIDARHTFGALIDPAQLPRRWMRRIRGTQTSRMAYILYLGTDLDLDAIDVPVETIIMPTWDLDQPFHVGPADPVSDISVTVPTQADPDLAPPGRHIVMITGFAPDDDTDIDQPAVVDHFLRLTEQAIPGLSDHIVYALGAQHTDSGPDSLPLHRLGPIYGWAPTPTASGPFRLPQATPIDNLHLVGHWTQPAFGIWGALASAVQAVRLILNRSPAAGPAPIRL